MGAVVLFPWGPQFESIWVWGYLEPSLIFPVSQQVDMVYLLVFFLAWPYDFIVNWPFLLTYFIWALTPHEQLALIIRE